MISAVLVVVVILGFAYLLYEQRQKKKNDTRSHHVVLLPGFPTVHIPVSRTRAFAEMAAQRLQWTYNGIWGKMADVYGEDPGPAQIAVIGTSEHNIEEDHKYVLWLLPGDKVFLKVGPTMYYWFARELHNMFRYQLLGIQHIYKPINDSDAKRVAEIELWIDSTYGGSNGD